MNQLVRPSELLSSNYYWEGIESIIHDFNSQVTSSAAQASYEDINIECNDLLANEVTKQLFESGWYSTTHDYGNDVVTITVDIHRSMLKQRWNSTNDR